MVDFVDLRCRNRIGLGETFLFVNYFLFDHLPFYNKFRAPSMALVLPQLGFPLLAALGLQQFADSLEKKEIQLKKFKEVLYIFRGTYFIKCPHFIDE